MFTKLPYSLILLTLAGCSFIPSYIRPSMQLPSSWQQQAKIDEAAANHWWKEFGNTELNKFIDEALQKNNDLQAALHRIDQARAGSMIAGAGLWPQATASGNSNKADRESATTRQLNLSYEVDLWGRNRAEKSASRARVNVSRYDRDALALIVTGDTAEAYVDIVSLRERLAIATENVGAIREVLTILEARFREGAVSALEVSQQRTALANGQAAVVSLENQLVVANNRLAILLGQAPTAISIGAKNLQALTMPSIAVTQPSYLLERRPDIRSSEESLIAANADIGAARAAFFPSLQLGLTNLVTDIPTSVTTLAASLTAPIFRGGSLLGQLQFSKARQLELVENYRKTVLTSMQEVEDALSSLKSAKERRTQFETAANEARNSYKLSRTRYLAGAIDFLTLLSTQQSQFQAEDNVVNARADEFSAAIALYKALGGEGKG